jgi:membrane protein insertase Oxa1/YidC/SpoIIIJ
LRQGSAFGGERWVLLAAIELRHAPFMLWIKDLSALDPYYVLPILMTATMVLQTRMNPVPPDPVQARVCRASWTIARLRLPRPATRDQALMPKIV